MSSGETLAKLIQHFGSYRGLSCYVLDFGAYSALSMPDETGEYIGQFDECERMRVIIYSVGKWWDADSKKELQIAPFRWVSLPRTLSQ